VFSVPTRTQYGIRALVHLARAGELADRDATTLSTSAEIARAESISPKYLEGILTQLKAKGIVLAERGKGGGYRLARGAAEIRMIDIVEALEGEVRPVDCVENSQSCVQGDACMPRRFWIGLKDAIDGYLSSKTLKDVIEI
jgi:Rrf2 family iron-sulfur cluster assembly transcriptional regulator